MRKPVLAWVAAWGLVAAIALAGCTAKQESAPPQEGAGGKAPTSEPAKAEPGKTGPAKAEPANGDATLPAPADKEGWQSVFDGRTLAGWKVTDFGGQGEVKVADGQIVLNMGAADLTGITWTGGELPKVNYEISCQAMRVDGSDFFCGLTFPVKDSWASLIVGGWGGSLVGISCLDNQDAANNETTKILSFANGRWYRIRVKITDEKIQAWIDDDDVVDANIKDRKVNVRWEVEASQPFGVAAWRTKSALKDIKIRRISE